MRKVASLLSCILLLCSCGISGNVVRNESIAVEASQAVLANIRIERWGKMRFSGIIALKVQEQAMSYVLLDATGVKLLEGEVDAVADRGGHSAEGLLSRSGLPRFLSVSLTRMFMLQPADAPCSRQMFFSLCRERTDDSAWNTSYTAGPFLVWEVDEERANGTDWSGSIYSQPWLGVRMTLDKIN